MNVNDLNRIHPSDWPPSARRTIEAALAKGSRPADRVLAAQLAGEIVVMDDDLARRLLGIIRDRTSPDELRAAASIAFGPTLEMAEDDGWDDPDDVIVSEDVFHEIRRTLRQVYDDTSAPMLVRRRALEASIRAADDWHIGATRAAWASRERDWRLTAVFCMQFVEGFEKEILESLRSTDDQIHREAVAAAGNWGLRDAWKHIRDLADSGSTEKGLRLVAIDALAGFPAEQCADLLTELSASEDEEIADTASEALALAGCFDEADHGLHEKGDDLGELDDEDDSFEDGFDDAFGEDDDELPEDEGYDEDDDDDKDEDKDEDKDGLR